MTGPARSGVVLRRTVSRRISRPVVCAECGARFDGVACPGCGELVGARPVGQLGVVVEDTGGRVWLVVAVRGEGGRWHPTRRLAATDEAIATLARQLGPVVEDDEACERCDHALFTHTQAEGCWCGCVHLADSWHTGEVTSW